MLGGFLIALGLVWWLNLWWVLLPGLLIAGGVIAYRQRRSLGRPIEAVQAGLWCVGLALLFLDRRHLAGRAAPRGRGHPNSRSRASNR